MRGWVFGGVAWALVFGAPQAVSAQTMADALTAAYHNNPEILAARRQHGAASEAEPAALAAWLPTVRLHDTYSGSRSKDLRGEGTSSIRGNHRAIGVSVDQTLFRAGGNLARLQGARQDVERSRLLLRQQEQDVLLRTATAVLELRLQRHIVALRRDSLNNLDGILSGVREQFNLRRRNVADLSQAEARVARARAALAAAEGAEREADVRLRAITGLTDEAFETLQSAAPQDDGAGPLGAVDIEVTAFADRDALLAAARTAPAPRAAAAALESAEAAIRESVAQMLPTVSLRGSAERRHDLRSSGDWTTSTRSHSWETTIALRVDIPIFQGGATLSAMRAARETAAQRRHQLDATLSDAQTQAAVGWEALSTAAERLLSLNAEVTASRTAVEALRELERIGQRPLASLLDAEIDFFDAQIAQMTAQRDVVLARLNLAAAAGHFSADALGLNAALLPDE